MRRQYSAIVVMVLALTAGLSHAGHSSVLKHAYTCIDAWNSHDPQKVADYLTDEFTYYDAAMGNMTTKEQVKNFVQSFHTFSPDYKWALLGKPIVGHDSVAFEWTFAGTNTGPWGEKAASGRTYVIYGASLIRFNKQGKVVFEGDYWDQVDFHKQLDWIK
jgi:steroid delta-isomerase-like uncharacterized protein